MDDILENLYFSLCFQVVEDGYAFFEKRKVCLNEFDFMEIVISEKFPLNEENMKDNITLKML